MVPRSINGREMFLVMDEKVMVQECVLTAGGVRRTRMWCFKSKTAFCGVSYSLHFNGGRCSAEVIYCRKIHRSLSWDDGRKRRLWEGPVRAEPITFESVRCRTQLSCGTNESSQSVVRYSRGGGVKETYSEFQQHFLKNCAKIDTPPINS